MAIEHSDSDTESAPGAGTLIEGVARVVAVENGVAWLEPEQTASCGGCAAAGACGAKGVGTLAHRLEQRRFPLTNESRLVVGERVIVGIRDDALFKASLLAYALPLILALIGGVLAQARFAGDLPAVLGAFGGLVLGLLGLRIGATRLTAAGTLAPRYLRRAGTACDTRV